MTNFPQNNASVPAWLRALLRLIIGVGIVIPTLPGGGGSLPTHYFVAPNGSDTATGSKTHPWATLQHARDVVRLLNDNMTQDITITLAGGTYKLTSPLTLTGEDSGTNGHSVIYQAAAGATPVVSGGKRITGWTLFDAAKGIYRVPVGDLETRELFVDGVRAPRAAGEMNPAGFTETATGFSYSGPLAMSTWGNKSDIEAVSAWGWKLYRCPINSISGSAITMQEPCWTNANLHQDQDFKPPTWIENAYELLDSPGEWYLDRAANNLYYKPLAGQNMSSAQVIAPTVEKLIDAVGTPAAPVSNITFDGITFSHTTWLEPNGDGGVADVQAGWRIVGSGHTSFDETRADWKATPGSLSFVNSRNIVFSDNRFEHLGSVGLSLGTGTKNATVVGNVLTDIASNGIQLGNTTPADHHPSDPRTVTEDNLIANNAISNVGAQYWAAVGIVAGYTARTTIEHNKLFNLPYSAISTGWGWGLTDQGGNPDYPNNLGQIVYDSPTASRETTIQYNEITNVMTKLADGGGIYTIGASPDSVIRGNAMDTIPLYAYGAIYHDEASRYWHSYNNSACNVARQWLIMNNAIDSTVEHNFADKARIEVFRAKNDVVRDNTLVDGCAQVPASILAGAGLEAAYQHLSPAAPQADTTAPSAPGQPDAEVRLSTMVDLSWAPSTDGTGVTGYEIWANDQLITATNSSTLTARISNLVPGTAYSFTVRARDGAANLSAPSSAAALTLPASAPNLALDASVVASSEFSDEYRAELAVDGDPSTRWAQGAQVPGPSSLTIDLGGESDVTAVVVNFERPDGYTYLVQYSPDGETWSTFDDRTGTPTTTATNYSFASSGLSGRYIRVLVIGSGGWGGSLWEVEVYGSAPAAGGDQTAPSVPGQPSATPQLPSVVDLNWSAATDDTGVTGYRVFQDGALIATTADTGLRVTGLTAGQQYSFEVRAKDAAGNVSAASPSTSVTMPTTTNLSLVASASASSQFSNDYSASKAIDGDNSSRWAQQGGAPDPSWLQVDLGAVRAIDGVVTSWEKSNGYSFVIETSVDGITWSVLDDQSATSTGSATVTSVAPDGSQGRYVRLTVTNSSGSGGSVWELAVFGSPA